MSEKYRLRWSDVWLLVSIYFCSLNDQGSLRDIVAMADRINHAVFNFEEFSSGVMRLERHGLIFIEADAKILKCTEKTLQLVKETDFSMNPQQLLKEMEVQLGVEPWNAKEVIPHPDNHLLHPLFAKDYYAKEIKEYISQATR